MKKYYVIEDLLNHSYLKGMSYTEFVNSLKDAGTWPSYESAEEWLWVVSTPGHYTIKVIYVVHQHIYG